LTKKKNKLQIFFFTLLPAISKRKAQRPSTQKNHLTTSFFKNGEQNKRRKIPAENFWKLSLFLDENLICERLPFVARGVKSDSLFVPRTGGCWTRPRRAWTSGGVGGTYIWWNWRGIAKGKCKICFSRIRARWRPDTAKTSLHHQSPPSKIQTAILLQKNTQWKMVVPNLFKWVAPWFLPKRKRLFEEFKRQERQKNRMMSENATNLKKTCFLESNKTC